jgi:hypothetical protein
VTLRREAQALGIFATLKERRTLLNSLRGRAKNRPLWRASKPPDTFVTLEEKAPPPERCTRRPK